MIKKFLAKLVNWESSRKSNWTKAMEAQGLSEDERKKIMDKAREDLEKEQIQIKDRSEPAKEEWEKAA